MDTLNLAASLHRRYCETPDHGALFVAGAHYSYGDLGDTAGRTAAVVLERSAGSGRRVERVGVLASRSLAAYAGVMAAVWLGAAYVPLNIKFPETRLAVILKNAELDALVVDEAGLKRLTPALLALCPPVIVAPCADLSAAPDAAPPGLLDRAALAGAPGVARLVAANPDDPAYLLYTSGTTGEPKGVVVTNANLRHYLNVAPKACGFGEGERTSQHAELSFDLCTHDLFTAWEMGAKLHVVPEDQLMAPAEFINAHQLTVWVSVPAVIAFLRAMRLLKPGIFPSLRVSGFGGEALPKDLADAWLAAAPNSRLLNGYGPTEATIGCTLHEYAPHCAVTPERGIVPVGVCHAGTVGGVVDEDGNFLPPRCAGQIVFHGPQLSAGYWKQPELTARAFPMLHHPQLGRTRWYLTGDHGYQDEDGVFHFLGRMDSQVKVLGHRIELDDVEHHLREVCGADAAAVVAWPLVDGAAQGLVGFVSRLPGGVKKMRDALKGRLPLHMVPGRLYLAESMPLNANGKIDRRALAARLDREVAPG